MRICLRVFMRACANEQVDFIPKFADESWICSQAQAAGELWTGPAGSSFSCHEVIITDMIGSSTKRCIMKVHG
jgi:hypothetical protein